MNRIDELKAEIENAERKLKNKREEFVRLTEIREGDYIEVTTSDGVIIGRLEAVGSNCFNGTVYKVKTWSDKKTFILKSIKKWQPRKGDLCIFWDYEKEHSTIGIFNGIYFSEEQNYLFYRANINICKSNCIPFISLEQFKEHIGYE